MANEAEQIHKATEKLAAAQRELDQLKSGTHPTHRIAPKPTRRGIQDPAQLERVLRQIEQYLVSPETMDRDGRGLRITVMAGNPYAGWVSPQELAPYPRLDYRTLRIEGL